jgi:hypothetical protein
MRESVLLKVSARTFACGLPSWRFLCFVALLPSMLLSWPVTQRIVNKVMRHSYVASVSNCVQVFAAKRCRATFFLCHLRQLGHNICAMSSMGVSALPLLGFSRICCALFDIRVSRYLSARPLQLVCARVHVPQLQHLHRLLRALLVQSCHRMCIPFVSQTHVYLHVGSVPWTNVDSRKTQCIFHDLVVPFLGPAFSHHFWAHNLQT